ncbi:phage scaffolding protein [Paenibacillus sp. FSL R7-0128]|uniref:phage scaffolding protein n=1 Tax=Paenibacillus sp. FSL R7-0128 TaxID=2954529 RepID=UPI0030FB3BB7
MTNKMKPSRYPMNLQLFASGDPDPADPKPDPDPTPPVPDKTFTKADLDRIVAERLARDRKGREDYDDIKTKLTALEQAEAEREAAKLSDTERLEAEKATALAAAESAKAERDKALTTANHRLINAEFKALAREANVPAERLAAALKLADLAGATVDENGDVVGVKEAVEALVAAEPYLVAETKPKPIGGSSGGQPDEDGRRTLEAQLAEARKAKNFSKVIEISNKLSKK